MIIFPAIDIIDGKPVRLFKGDFATTEQVAENALEIMYTESDIQDEEGAPDIPPIQGHVTFDHVTFSYE